MCEEPGPNTWPHTRGLQVQGRVLSARGRGEAGKLGLASRRAHSLEPLLSVFVSIRVGGVMAVPGRPDGCFIEDDGESTTFCRFAELTISLY